MRKTDASIDRSLVLCNSHPAAFLANLGGQVIYSVEVCESSTVAIHGIFSKNCGCKLRHAG
jgi:hypothetical protein